jgi:DNA-binding PadR family transcriptional regulator
MRITVSDIGNRKWIGTWTVNAVNRELLLSFWKLHILHHAGIEPVHGQWVLTELRRHGHEISPGTLYPLLKRMERLGWLKGRTAPGGGRRARRDYRLSGGGRRVLELMRAHIQELHEEVVGPDRTGGTSSREKSR